MDINDKIVITGGESMIGKHLARLLSLNGYKNIYQTSHKELDLLDFGQTVGFFQQTRPDYVFNLAGYNGNIAFSQKWPASIYYQTTQIALNCLQAAQIYGVKKCVNVLSSCAIADIGDSPLREDGLWSGLPNSTIEAHGLAKRTWDAFSRQLYKQYGFNSVCTIVNNSFGEWDNTDINKTKAVMGIIARVVDAQRKDYKEITCWGTGEVYREFIYAGDVARCLVQVMNNYNDPMCPINVTSTDEISIKNLTNKVAEIVGYDGKILWDTSKPDGQKRKSLDKILMLRYINLSLTPIAQSLENTINWYKETK